jgi:anti-sigma factor RsiW
MSFSDETLMAYADGELDETARAGIERAMRSDPALAARVAQHQALRSDVFAAFAPIADEPVPPSLLAAAMPGKVSDLGAARAARSESRRRWAWPEWGAIAASLSFGVLVGSMVLGGGVRGGGGGSGSGAGVVGNELAALRGADGTPVAQGRLAEALSTQLAGAAQTGGVKIGVTFASIDGQLCRSFVAGESAGLACRSGEQWKLAVLAEVAKGAPGEYQQAGSAMPAVVLEAIDARIAGPALDAQAEQAARQRGWRR